MKSITVEKLLGNNKNYQQVQKKYRQLSLEIETIQQAYEKVKNKYLEIKTKISSLNQQIIQEQEIYDELDNKYHTALDAFINEEEFLKRPGVIEVMQDFSFAKEL